MKVKEEIDLVLPEKISSCYLNFFAAVSAHLMSMFCRYCFHSNLCDRFATEPTGFFPALNELTSAKNHFGNISLELKKSSVWQDLL